MERAEIILTKSTKRHTPGWYYGAGEDPDVKSSGVCGSGLRGEFIFNRSAPKIALVFERSTEEAYDSSEHTVADAMECYKARAGRTVWAWNHNHRTAPYARAMFVREVVRPALERLGLGFGDHGYFRWWVEEIIEEEA